MRSIGIRQQLLLFALVPLIVVIAGSGLTALYNYHVEVDVLQERQALRTARVLARLTAPALIAGNTAGLQQLFDSAIDQDICGIKLLSTDHKLITSSGKVSSGSDRQQPVWWHDGTLSARWPIYRYNHTNDPLPEGSAEPLLGWVIVNSNQKSVTQYRYETITASLIWILLALLIVSFLGSNISKKLDQRIHQLRTTLSRLDSHEWSTRLKPSDNPDWQRLTTVINDLSHRAQQQVRHLQNQVDHSHQDLQHTLESLEISNIELELARKEALSASQSKSDFLANTSHEVRTPLTGILGFCKVLLRSEQNPRKREYLETIRRSAEHLLGILNDVLDLSKIEAGKFSLDHRPFDLLPVVEESVCLFSHQAADNDIELIIEAIEPLPAQIIGDGARLKQLIANLVSNAVKFTERGQVLVRLNSKPAGENQLELNIDVNDTGIGIDSSEQHQLFKAFQQLDSSPTRAQGGTGLGLAIVRNLVKQMGGTISLSSKKHQGTNFSVTLPLQCVTEPAPATRRKLNHSKALLWERNPDSRRALSHRLQAHGIEVEHIETANNLPCIPAVPDNGKLILSLRNETELREIEGTLPAGRTSILLPSLSEVLTRTDFDFVQKPVADSLLLAQFLATGNAAPRHRNTESGKASDRLNVLVVDDNANNRLLLNVLLDDLGAVSELYSNGPDALLSCEEKYYPLIILDLQMPGMSGADVAGAIRATRLNSKSHIVALTAHGSPDAFDAHTLNHFDDFLTKPVNPETLRSLLVYCSQKCQSAWPPLDQKAVCLAECLRKSDHRPALAQRLLAKFLDGLVNDRQEWLESKQTCDPEVIRNLTHQLQGACAYVGTPGLATAVASLQTALSSGPSWSILVAETENVVAEIERLIDWHKDHDLDALFESDTPA